MKIELIVFDLDGTLTSSHETIYKSTVYTLNKLKIPGELPHDKFCKRIGLHFEDIFNEFEIPVNNYDEFIKIYKSMYFEFIDSSEVYSGVQDTLKELKSKKIKTALLTTKTQDQADKITNYFKLDSDLDYIMGRRPGLAHKPSPEPLLKICKDFNVEPDNCMIVGDSEMDIQCGKNANAKTCGVTYGYRSRADLENELPDFLIDNIGDLTPIVENFN
jgi:HAD superfamily hydrolase (TIGR01549 family)